MSKKKKKSVIYYFQEKVKTIRHVKKQENTIREKSVKRNRLKTKMLVLADRTYKELKEKW